MASNLHVNIYGVEWFADADDSHCPACAEAERIAAWCNTQASRVLSERSSYYDDRDVRAYCYDAAAEFARGERR